MRILIGLSLLCVSLLQVQASWAASYSLPAATFPPCSGTWNQSQNSCDGRVIFGVGDSVTASVALTIQAERGFELKGSNTLGSNNHGISLKSTYGSIVVRASGSIFGAIASDSGEVDLTGTQVSGSVTGSGNARFKDSKIGGLVQRNNGISANNTEFQSGIAVSNGSVDLTGGKVQGDIQAANGIKTSLVNINGAINSPNGAVELQGGEVKGNVTGGCCKISLSDLRLTGNIRLTNNDIELDGSEVVGNITTTNRVHLKMSTVWGNVTAASWDAQTIKGTGNSAIYGVCKPSDTTPQKLCQDAPPVAVHHYRLSFATPMLSCQPIPVTVTACADSACSSTVSTSDSITLTPAGAWIGGERKSFAGSDTLTAYLKREAVTRVLGVSGASYACSPANCTLDIKDSGFVFSNLTPIIAGKTQSAVIQAVKVNKDDANQACVPAFTGGPRTLQFSAAYVTPDTGSLSPSVAGVALEPVGSSKDVRLTFDAEAKAAFKVVYADAGEVRLTASYVGAANPGNPATSEELLSMSGSASFVSRPYGLCLQTAAVQGNDYSATSSLFPGDVRAGDSFDLTIKPVVWTKASEEALDARKARNPDALPQASDICGSVDAPVPETPNYEQVGSTKQTLIRLTVDELNGGHAGVLGVSSHAHPRGGAMVIDQSISEVGVFQVTATPPDYLGADMSHAVSQSGRVGRFIPASFLLEDPEVTPGCGSFTYAGLVDKGGASAQPGKEGQPFVVSGVLSARNRAGDITRNYKGSFAKLMADGVAYADDGNGVNPITGGSSTAEVTAGAEDGYLAYRNSDLRFRFDTPEAPYRLATRVTVTDTDKVSGSVVDMVVDASGTADPSRLPEFRLGLARVGNAHGSELHDLELPFATAYFDGSNYVPNTLDNCTTFGAASLGPYQHAGSGSGAPSLEPGLYQAVAGGGSYLIKAPADGSSGSARLTYDGVSSWLQFDWDGDGGLDDDDKPSGLATFGIYRGPAPLIFRRELYRQ